MTTTTARQIERTQSNVDAVNAAFDAAASKGSQMARNGDDVRTLPVAVAEATGANLSPATIQVMMTKLRMYELDAVLSALDRCLMECKRPLTMADIVERMQQHDGRPGADEAWAMCPKSEDDAAVWTQEMSAAFSWPVRCCKAGDEIAALALRSNKRMTGW